VKIVIGANTDSDQFDEAIGMVATLTDQHLEGPVGPISPGIDQRPDIFLQPMTPFGAATAAPSPEQVLEFHERALRRYPRVRVVPQTHKSMGQL
jgi:hypothetical protein